MKQSPSEKLIVPQLAKIFLVFLGTRMFISAYKRACHLSIPWTSLEHEGSEVQDITILTGIVGPKVEDFLFSERCL